MARFLKNTEINTGSYSIRLPLGNGVRPDNPVDGQIRYNTDNNSVEVYYNNTWNALTIVGRVPISIESFQGDGSQISFTLTQDIVEATDVLVFIGGVYQTPNVHYTLVGVNTLVFVDPPPNSSMPHNPNNIIVIHNLNTTSAI